MVRNLAFAALTLVALTLAPAKPFAQELGLTPSNVVSLWTNINDCLVASSRAVLEDGGLESRLEAMRATAFPGKKPKDVLRQVTQFRAKLDRLRQSAELSRTTRYGTGDGKVTPSIVFLNSGHVLDGVVDWFIRKTGPDQLAARFYTLHAISGKKPSDAYSMVELANRRLNLILGKLNLRPSA